MSLLSRTFLNTLLPAAILIGIAAVVLTFAQPFQIRVAYVFFINLTMVLGLQVFMGNTGIASFGHVGFQGIAAYAVAILLTPVALKKTMIPGAPLGLDLVQFGPVVSIAIAIVVTAIIAYVVGLAICRLSGVAAEIGTLAFLVIVQVTFTNWVGLFRGPRAFYGIPTLSSLPWGVAAAIGAIFVAKLFRDSEIGVQLRASSENMLAARAMGVEVERLRLVAWVVSGILVGVGGVLLATFLGTIAPSAFYFNQTFLIMAMLLLGGMRSVTGAICGTIVISIGSEFTRALESGPTWLGVKMPEMFGLTGFFLGAIIVLVMTLRRDGLFGDDELEDWVRGWWRGRSGNARADDDVAEERA